MRNQTSTRDDVPALRDAGEGPVPSAWRPTLAHIVDAFVRRDYRLAGGVDGVAPLSEEAAADIEAAIRDYGATLVQLDEQTWNTSVYIWMEDHWDALVDLWTKEEGRSDLVMQVRVTENEGAYTVSVYMVYVP